MQKFCQNCDVYGTQRRKTQLNNYCIAADVADLVIKDAYTPLHDRIKNLTTPQKIKKGSKNVRKKIVAAILKIIIGDDISSTQSGLALDRVQKEVEVICKTQDTPLIQSSNITQELGNLHLREENRQTGQNFIPLFYFDKTNRKVLVIEPTIYMIKEYDCKLLQNILNELLAVE